MYIDILKNQRRRSEKTLEMCTYVLKKKRGRVNKKRNRESATREA